MSEIAKKSKIVKPLRSGQITIPIEFRRELGIDENTLLEVSLSDGELRLHRVELEPAKKGSPWLKELYDYFEPVRQEILESGITQQELFDLIDEAVHESREARFGLKKVS